MGDRDDKITSLSGGNQQKVLIGRAFALNPNILILNDPARGVDVGAKADLYAHLRDFAAAGKSVIYMSSEIEELVGFCSRVLVFRNGHVFAELTGDAIDSDEILAAMFGQHATTHATPSGGRLGKSVTGKAGTLAPAIVGDLEVASGWSRPKPERRAVPSFTLRSLSLRGRRRDSRSLRRG